MGRQPTARDPLGQRLVSLRRTAGLTQAQLAKQLNLPQATWSYWERTGLLPGIDLYRQLARCFHVSVDSLIRPHWDRRSEKTTRIEALAHRARTLPTHHQHQIADLLEALIQQAER